MFCQLPVRIKPVKNKQEYSNWNIFIKKGLEGQTLIKHSSRLFFFFLVISLHPQDWLTAPSKTLKDLSTSTVKSTCPGVSMMLIWWPFHLTWVAADWIVIPRSRSNSIESIVAPTLSFPLTCRKKIIHMKFDHIQTVLIWLCKVIFWKKLVFTKTIFEIYKL